MQAFWQVFKGLVMVSLYIGNYCTLELPFHLLCLTHPARLDVSNPSMATDVTGVRFLITRNIEQASMLSVLRESIAATGIAPLRTAITQRQGYVKSVLDGETVFDTNDGAAKGEVEVLASEILKIVA